MGKTRPLFKKTGGIKGTCHAGKEGPSPREDGDVSGVSSSCGSHGGFLARHGEDLREPLVRRQGSQVSLQVARRSAL